jgi:hypothetical protein
MGESARKLNFMISLDVADELESLVPNGQRSKVVSEAIRKELIRFRRWKLTEKLMAIRREGPVLSTDGLLNGVRNDRKRG